MGTTPASGGPINLQGGGLRVTKVNAVNFASDINFTDNVARGEDRDVYRRAGRWRERLFWERDFSGYYNHNDTIDTVGAADL